MDILYYESRFERDILCYVVFSHNESNEPNIQTCFLGCNQTPRITSIRANALTKLLVGPLQKSIFGVTAKMCHATFHSNTIFPRMVSIIYCESGLVYGENDAGFRLLNFTRTGGWASLTLARGTVSVQSCCCSCCCWVDDRNDVCASGAPPASACKSSHHPVDPTSHWVVEGSMAY